jgi:hypothetical protein
MGVAQGWRAFSVSNGNLRPLSGTVARIWAIKWGRTPWGADSVKNMLLPLRGLPRTGDTLLLQGSVMSLKQPY